MAVFPAAMVVCGNMTVNALENSRKDVTQNKKIRDKKLQEECHILKLQEVTEDQR